MYKIKYTFLIQETAENVALREQLQLFLCILMGVYIYFYGFQNYVNQCLITNLVKNSDKF